MNELYHKNWYVHVETVEDNHVCRAPLALLDAESYDEIPQDIRKVFDEEFAYGLPCSVSGVPGNWCLNHASGKCLWHDYRAKIGDLMREDND